MVPLLPPDHPHSTTQSTEDDRSSRQTNKDNAPPHKRSKSTVSLRSLGRDKEKDKERKSRKEREKEKQSQRATNDPDNRDGRTRMKKTKSSTSLRGLLGKMNRSSKDLGDTVHDKENLSPPLPAVDPTVTSHWPQNPPVAQHLNAEIDRYTPRDYTPSKQRDFAAYGQPALSRPSSSGRPKSMVIPGSTSFLDMLNRPASRDHDRERSQLDSRRTNNSRGSRESFEDGKQSFGRKVSSSSNERPAPKSLANIPKRGPRVMAAVAAFDEKAREGVIIKDDQKLDPKTVDAAFEAVLDSRNIPENMRQKMRTLTLRVKADFVKQDKGALSPTKPESRLPFFHDEPVQQQTADSGEEEVKEDLSKRSRSRSKTFTLTRSDDTSKKSKSDSRPNSIHIPRSSGTLPKHFVPSSPGRGPQAACPDEFVAYLDNVRDPVQMEVGRLHKLRLLLRNETVAWVDNFISLGGMAQVVDLLHRIMQIEWREEHEDQLLHEALLCLKGLCTTEVALKNLAALADALFPKLLAMIFDEEKKGPSEFTTRGIIINILFAYLGAARNGGPYDLAQRARVILAYLADPQKPEDAQPVSFVLSMRQSRPYKVWCTEVSNVTKEVFWIFLHHLNVIPLPKKEMITPGQTYAERFFPGDRPPVPAAPYIGGVEWDATTYMTSHLDLVNGLIASLPSREDRNQLRSELKTSGWEKMMGGTMRTCKEKFYCGVHSGLQNWIAAAQADGWDIDYVRYGPSKEEMAASSPKKSPRKTEAPPQIGFPIIQMPKLTLGLDRSNSTPAFNASNGNDGWLV
ncbi:hypothetical protein M436DRAFT_42025 [Aureobasidium namibiae CBS 147.97]|uniref:Formin GTPase-binding domain-containing protein n=1 Tax=Aureobasidium namibiae CBS 147.97 TaxID=1043004 RepID=A0A074X0F7_9PEZI|nr:uncharacterized protein M436DRAFT_42025 [Aureobasidium namibiae CBS 147.97]KEQ75532.1 hypothetical protein M436DRAFT_42025 [Aureobasidium namibiae CBS 147.97]